MKAMTITVKKTPINCAAIYCNEQQILRLQYISHYCRGRSGLFSPAGRRDATLESTIRTPYIREVFQSDTFTDAAPTYYLDDQETSRSLNLSIKD